MLRIPIFSLTETILRSSLILESQLMVLLVRRVIYPHVLWEHLAMQLFSNLRMKVALGTGHLTQKCDIYGFGVLLLEMLSGRRAFDVSRPAMQRNLVDWAKPYLRHKHKIRRVIDASLGGLYSFDGVQKIAALAFDCLCSDPKKRPTMDNGLCPGRCSGRRGTRSRGAPGIRQKGHCKCKQEERQISLEYLRRWAVVIQSHTLVKPGTGFI